MTVQAGDLFLCMLPSTSRAVYWSKLVALTVDLVLN